MFSGIIEELGVVQGVSRRGNCLRLSVKAGVISPSAGIGESIAVNGVCLTVVENDAGVLGFDVMPETLRTTTLRVLRVAEKVNLEQALIVGKRVSGHFVSGHVDCVAAIRRKVTRSSDVCFDIALPPAFSRYVVPRGSIAVDGISLTVAAIRSGTVSVCLIPHTLHTTTLGFKGPSDKVNLEFDMLLKKGNPPPGARKIP